MHSDWQMHIGASEIQPFANPVSLRRAIRQDKAARSAVRATIALMILVNNPGSWSIRYPQITHAAWSDWTMTDMVLPFFLWIMGMAMTLSFAKRRAAGATTQSLMIHSLKRSAIPFAPGILLNAFRFGAGTPFSFATLRIPGTPQRIESRG
jgi:predicted acyltransferase